MKRLDRRGVPANRSEIRLFACMRNERTRLPAFLDHYRRLGVDRFFLVDNGSDDGSLDLAASERDVHLFATRARFSRSRSGLDWIEPLLERFAADAWCVCVDLDEFLVYCGCETRGLHALSGSLEGAGASALFSLLLDVYGRGPITETKFPAVGDPIAATPWYDPDSHRRSGPNSRGYPTAAHERAGLEHWRGGMRRRVFGLDLCLNKVPFFRNGTARRATQGQHFMEGVRVGRETGASLHLKYFADFLDVSHRAVRRGEHWQRASAYRSYARALSRKPDLSAWYEGSRAYAGSDSLLESGILNAG